MTEDNYKVCIIQNYYKIVRMFSCQKKEKETIDFSI